MVSPHPLTMNVVQNRRNQLKRWIDELFGGNQAAFGASTNDGKTQINQGEVSGLLRDKSFGEKRARSLEKQAHMPLGYLESDTHPGEAPPKAPTNRVQESGHGAASLPAKPISWPFHLVSPSRLKALQQALGPRTGNEAMRDIDAFMDQIVAKWEKVAATKKKASGL